MPNYRIRFGEKPNRQKPLKKNLELIHSAKGSTWGNHKYIRIENGRYIYQGDQSKVTPNNSDLSKIDTSNINIDKNNMVDIANDKLDEKGTNQIAKLLVGGLYGDAANAKKLLGKNYESIRAAADKMVEDNTIDENEVKTQMEQANKLVAALGKTEGIKSNSASTTKSKSSKSSKSEKEEKDDDDEDNKTEKTETKKKRNKFKTGSATSVNKAEKGSRQWRYALNNKK